MSLQKAVMRLVEEIDPQFLAVGNPEVVKERSNAADAVWVRAAD